MRPDPGAPAFARKREAPDPSVDEKRGDTRERLLEACIELVAKRGYAGTSISMICRKAGLHASSIYWLFDNKEDLFLAAIRDGAADFLQSVELPEDVEKKANDSAYDEIVTAVGSRLSSNASFLRLLLLMMLEDADLSPQFRIEISAIRRTSLDWWERLLARQFAPLGATTAGLLAADFAPLCRAAINGAFIAQQYGEPVDIVDTMRKLMVLVAALRERLATEANA